MRCLENGKKLKMAVCVKYVIFHEWTKTCKHQIYIQYLLFVSLLFWWLVWWRGQLALESVFSGLYVLDSDCPSTHERFTGKQCMHAIQFNLMLLITASLFTVHLSSHHWSCIKLLLMQLENVLLSLLHNKSVQLAKKGVFYFDYF